MVRVNHLVCSSLESDARIISCTRFQTIVLFRSDYLSHERVVLSIERVATCLKSFPEPSQNSGRRSKKRSVRRSRWLLSPWECHSLSLRPNKPAQRSTERSTSRIERCEWAFSRLSWIRLSERHACLAHCLYSSYVYMYVFLFSASLGLPRPSSSSSFSFLPSRSVGTTSRPRLFRSSNLIHLRRRD